MRFFLAYEFWQAPQVILLDDPTEGLKNERIKKLAQTILAHRKNFNLKHIILATEDETFLKHFDFETVELSQNEIVLNEVLIAS